MTLVLKRSNKAQEFNVNKLSASLEKVFASCKHEFSDEILQSILSEVQIVDGMRTEELQRSVENALMKLGYHDEARYYIIYRHIHYHDRTMASKVSFMKEYLSASNAATGSKYDANANVTEKNLVTLSGELFKGDTIQLNRFRMYSKISEMYGKALADRYIWLLENHYLYKHDESSILSYCVAVTMYPYLYQGISGLGGLSTPPKNLDSFCGSFPNLMFAVAAQFAGAVASPEFLAYFDKFARVDLGENYMDSLDQFYTIGPKLRELMNKTGFWFRNVDELEAHDFEDDELNKLRNEIVLDSSRGYTQEEINSWKDDPLSNVNFENKIGDGSRTIKGYLTQKFQQVVYTLNQPAAARLYQSIFWNIGYFDKYYFEGIFHDFQFPDGSKLSWESLSKLQKFFMKWFNKERTKSLLTFPVESFSLLSRDGKFLDEDSADFVAEMYSEGHSFFTYISDNPDALSSCCRLRNEVTENVFSFSLGAGGVATGSKSVMTLNLNRIIQEAVKNKKNYLTAIRDLVREVQKFQLAFNEILYEYKSFGALQVYDAGFISLEKQYLTLGVNGMVEAAEFLGIPAKPTPEYQEFVDSILTIFYEENRNLKSNKIQFNTEFVPAENLGVKNYNWDKKDGYVVPTNRNCYNSYFFASEDEDLTVLDKLKLHGHEFVKNLDGGSACHINLSEHLSKTQYRQILNTAALNGTNYFTFNIPNTVCKECGHIDKRYLDHCPECGSENVDYATRIIGYLKLISKFSEPRQEEADRRAYIGPRKIQ